MHTCYAKCIQIGRYTLAKLLAYQNQLKKESTGMLANLKGTGELRKTKNFLGNIPKHLSLYSLHLVYLH